MVPVGGLIFGGAYFRNITVGHCLFGLIYEVQKFSSEIKSVLRRVLQALK